MPFSVPPTDIFHLYPDGTNHVLHLRSRLKQTVLFNQFEAVRVALKRPLKPSVVLIVVRRFGVDAPWQATMVKLGGQSRIVPLSALVHRPQDVTDGVATTPTAATTPSAHGDVEVDGRTPTNSACATPTREQMANWDTKTTSIVSVKEVSIRPHVYSSTEQLFQQVNDMTDIVHAHIVRVVTTATHNGFFCRPGHGLTHTGVDAPGGCTSGAVACPAPTAGAAFGRDPALIIVEEFYGTASVADCLHGEPRRVSPSASSTSPSLPVLASPALPGRRLLEPQVAAVVHDALLALRYLHDTCQRCHHRINAANLLLDSNHGKVVLRQSWEYTECLDWRVKASPRTGASGLPPPTAPGALPLGIGGVTNSYADDMWMLGVTILEMLLGQTADRFQRVQRIAMEISRHTSAKVMVSAGDSEPSRILLRQAQRQHMSRLYPEVFAGLSLELLDVLARCLDSDPGQREPARVLLAHTFFSGVRTANVVERSRVLGSILALGESPSKAAAAGTAARPGSRALSNVGGHHVERLTSMDRRRLGRGIQRSGTHRRSSSNASDSSLESSPSTVATYRTAEATASKRRPTDRLARPTPASSTPTTTTTATTPAHHATEEAEVEVSITDSAVSPNGTFSTMAPATRRRSEVESDHALHTLKARYLRSMRGPSAVELLPAARTGRIAAVMPDSFQNMLSSFPTQPRHRLGRRLRSTSIANSIESVGLRSFPITFTILDPAMEATVSFLQTVSMVLCPLSTKELAQMEKTDEWPYDLGRARHYLRTSGPTPSFEAVLAPLQNLHAQCKLLHNTSPALTLQFIRTLAVNYRNLEHGKTPFLHRWMRMEQDVQQRLQQPHPRRGRGGAAGTGAPHTGGTRSPPAAARHAGADPAATPRAKSRRVSAIPTAQEAALLFSPEAMTSSVAPITFAGTEEPMADEAPRANAANFLFDRWIQSAPGTAF